MISNSGFLILVFLFFISRIWVTLTTGIYLILGISIVLSLTPAVNTAGVIIMSVSSPGVNLLSSGLFMLYFVLNMDSLIEIWLDYKERGK
jgi:hypothetical protein